MESIWSRNHKILQCVLVFIQRLFLLYRKATIYGENIFITCSSVRKKPKCWLRVFIAVSLESARKNAANANYTTSDEERLGRGKRLHVAYNRLQSDTDEQENSQVRKYTKSKVSQTHILYYFPIVTVTSSSFCCFYNL